MNQVKPAIPPVVVTVLTIALAFCTIAAFASMFGCGIVAAWIAKQKPEYGDAFLHVATVLAGLVGGIVAVGFGQKPPAGAGDKRARRPSWRKLDRATWGPWTSLNLAVLGRLVTHDVPSDRWRSIAGGVYAIVYFIWGIAAVVTWVFFTAVTPDLVKNLAATFLGLALPVVTAFMRRG